MCLTTALEELCGEAGANSVLRRRLKQQAREAAALEAAQAPSDGAARPSTPAWQPSWQQAQSMSADSLMPIVIYCSTFPAPASTVRLARGYADGGANEGRLGRTARRQSFVRG